MVSPKFTSPKLFQLEIYYYVSFKGTLENTIKTADNTVKL